MASELINLLIKKNYTISSIESFTGGNFSHKLTLIPNASKAFIGSLIVYSKEIKTKFIEFENNEDFYTKEFANKMVKSLIKFTNSNIGISFSGIADVSNCEESFKSKLGHSYISIYFNNEYYDYYFKFSGTREQIIEQATNKGIELIKKIIS